MRLLRKVDKNGLACSKILVGIGMVIFNLESHSSSDTREHATAKSPASSPAVLLPPSTQQAALLPFPISLPSSYFSTDTAHAHVVLCFPWVGSDNTQLSFFSPSSALSGLAVLLTCYGGCREKSGTLWEEGSTVAQMCCWVAQVISLILTWRRQAIYFSLWTNITDAHCFRTCVSKIANSSLSPLSWENVTQSIEHYRKIVLERRKIVTQCYFCRKQFWLTISYEKPDQAFWWNTSNRQFPQNTTIVTSHPSAKVGPCTLLQLIHEITLQVTACFREAGCLSYFIQTSFFINLL